MKDPAFLFYPNDYLGGTMGMTFEQKGAYIELLMTQFNRGHMTSHMIGQVLGQNGGQVWETIKDKFQIDADGKYFNIRLEDEQNKRKAFTDSRRNNLEGKNQYPKNETHKKGHMSGHMENVNEIEVDNKNFLSFFDLKTLESELLNSTVWIEAVSVRHHTDIEKVTEYIKTFCLDQDVKESKGRTLKDYKSHFINWMGKELEKVGKVNGKNSKEFTYNEAIDLIQKGQAVSFSKSFIKKGEKYILK